jgi:hypothetical protein
MVMDEDALIRKTTTLPESLWDSIERFRVRVRAVTLTEAVRRLIVIALRAEGIIDDDPRDRQVYAKAKR